MSSPEQKITQYITEAHASEVALTSVLAEQIAMTPAGAYRSGLEKHLDETRDHASRLRERLNEIGPGAHPLQLLAGLAQATFEQGLALAKAPLDMLRGSGGEEKVLKNAKDAAATEALEIATYTALERLAHDLGDTTTARLAASIRADEERMLARIMREIPKLTAAVVRADVHGESSYKLSETGAADAVREVGETTQRAARSTAKSTGTAAKRAARGTAKGAKRTARQTRRAPGVTAAEGAAKGATASESDLPVAGYDGLNADEIVAKLPELSQVDLGTVEAYERRHDSRSTVLERISALRGDEPWTGYDEQTVAEIQTALTDADDDRARQVRDYERAHKNRAGVLEKTERELATS